MCIHTKHQTPHQSVWRERERERESETMFQCGVFKGCVIRWKSNMVRGDNRTLHLYNVN